MRPHDDLRLLAGPKYLGVYSSRLSSPSGFPRLPADNEACDDSDDYQHPFRGFIPLWRLVFSGLCFCLGALAIVLAGRRLPARLGFGLSALFYATGTLLAFAPWVKVNSRGQHYCGDNGWFHSGIIVTGHYRKNGR